MAENKINQRFLELLENQFPINDLHSSIKMRTPSDFAKKLNIHVNHLNRILKSIHHKTTTTLIGERIFLESKKLLTFKDWNVSEIAYCLGFTEVTHFNNFFKKNSGESPTQFRKSNN